METNLKSNKPSTFSVIISIGLWVIAIVYTIALLKIILFKSGFTTDLRGLNLIPFNFISDFFSDHVTIDVVLKNVVGNFTLFIPLTILLPSLFKKVTFKNTIFISFFVSLFFEVTQYVIGLGLSDVDDLILNTLGGIFGSLIYFAFLKKIDNKATIKIATFGFLSLFGICSVLSMYLYHPSLLPQQVESINKEILNGLDTASYNIGATCTAMEKGTLIVDTKKQLFASNYNPPVNNDGRYILSTDAQLFVRQIECKYSPNGNIQKTTGIYSKITKEDFKKMLEKENLQISLWMSSDNKCNTVLISPKTIRK